MEFTLISNPYKPLGELRSNHMKTGEARYFLSLIPKEPLASKIYGLKEDVAEEFRSKAALRSPAHLTLHMPFVWKERNEERLFQLLAQATNEEPFNLYLDGFGSFPPRTIYIKNKISAKLNAFHHRFIEHTRLRLKLLNSTHNRGFHPHITIAFRDLKKDMFDKAWFRFKEEAFSETMKVDSFWLLKHDGKKWIAYKEFPFSSADQ